MDEHRPTFYTCFAFVIVLNLLFIKGIFDPKIKYEIGKQTIVYGRKYAYKKVDSHTGILQIF